MAIRGIDANIMIAKSAEFAGEQAKVLRQNDLIADQAARQAARQRVLDSARALATSKVEGTRITPDKQDNGGGLYYPQKRHNSKKKGVRTVAANQKSSTIDIVI